MRLYLINLSNPLVSRVSPGRHIKRTPLTHNKKI